MKQRLVSITRCDECPKCAAYYYCTHPKTLEAGVRVSVVGRPVPVDKKIPDWCPLPEALKFFDEMFALGETVGRLGYGG